MIRVQDKLFLNQDDLSKDSKLKRIENISIIDMKDAGHIKGMTINIISCYRMCSYCFFEDINGRLKVLKARIPLILT